MSASPEARNGVHRKLFGGGVGGGKTKMEKEKVKTIREEAEPMINDAGDSVVDIDVDVDVDERLLDVGNNFASIRILERRYHQPNNDSDVEMATVLITFPRN